LVVSAYPLAKHLRRFLSADPLVGDNTGEGSQDIRLVCAVGTVDSELF